MPACAPTDNVDCGDWDWGDSSAGGDDVDGVLIVVRVVEVLVDAEVLLKEADEEDVRWTGTNAEELGSQFARTCGLEGSTSNRATPESQQKAWWSQQ
jgi:hypothetical protein